MEIHSLFEHTKVLRRALVLSVGVALLSVGCGDSEDGLTEPDAGTQVTPVTNTPGTQPEAGAAFDGSVVTTVDGGGGSTGGSVDTPWCKAKVVIDKYCIACHDGQGTGGSPMSLKTYADLNADSAAYPGTKIFKRVRERMNSTTKPMPARGGVSAAEIALVNAWVDSGGGDNGNASCTAPVGSDAGTPDGGSQVPYAQEWPKDCEKFWKVTMHDLNDATKPYTVAAGDEPHPHIVVDAPWGDEEVQALAFRPITDNKKVLHHWILYQNTSATGSTSGAGFAARPFLTGWAPGQDGGKPLPADVGMYLPKGKQSLYLDMHYYNKNAGAVPEKDASGVEICTVSKAKFRPNTATVTMSFTQIAIFIPGNASNYKVSGTCTVSTTKPVTLLSASPHAHKNAVSMEFFVTKKNGTVIPMHKAPFIFDEQQSYSLATPVTLETGDKVTTNCFYTNPTANFITFGENTGNEMCFNFAVYYPMNAGFSCR